MFNGPSGATPVQVGTEPTPLLNLIAGEFAARVARIWPAPHAEFLSAGAARRHLVYLALVHGRDVANLGRSILEHRISAALTAAAPGAPAGLARAVARLGEIAWPALDYQSLLRLLEDPRAAKLFRHSEQIEAHAVRRLASLPGAMAYAPALAAQLDQEQIGLLREVHDVIVFRDGHDRAAERAAAWARCKSVKALIAAVKDDLCPEPKVSPHPGTDRLRPLVTKADFKDAAKRYRNCLVEQTPYAATGQSAYYEWTGNPGAVVEITRDHVFGWRLEQARIAGNLAVPEALRAEIMSDLALMGAHVGRSGWDLERALNRLEHRRAQATPVAREIAEAFGAE